MDSTWLQPLRFPEAALPSCPQIDVQVEAHLWMIIYAEGGPAAQLWVQDQGRRSLLCGLPAG